MAYLVNDASVRGPSFRPVKTPDLNSGSFNVVKNSPVEIQIPETNFQNDSSVIDLDSLFDTPNPSDIKGQNANNNGEMSANMTPMRVADNGTGTSPNSIKGGESPSSGTTSSPIAPMSAGGLGSTPTGSTPVSLNSPNMSGSSLGGSKEAPSVGDGSEIGGNTANGIDYRTIYKEDAKYQAPDIVTTEINVDDIESIMQMDSVSLAQLLQNMSPPEYNRFIAYLVQASACG